MKSKGRILDDFLRYFGGYLFADQKDLPPVIIEILEKDKTRIQSLERELKKGITKRPPTQEEIEKEMLPSYTGNRPDLQRVFKIGRDYARRFQPFRVVLDSIDGVVDGQDFTLIGDENPLENLRDNQVPIAISNSDLAANKFSRELRQYFGIFRPWQVDIEDLQTIFNNLRTNATTVVYEGELAISESRHMFFANRSPSELRDLRFDRKRNPMLGRNSTVYIDGRYFFVYGWILGNKFSGINFNESENVESTVLNGNNGLKWGLYVVATGSTLSKMAKDGRLAVVQNPVYTSKGALFSNPKAQCYDDRAQSIIARIKEFNEEVKEQVGNGIYDTMLKNLQGHLIGSSVNGK